MGKLVDLTVRDFVSELSSDSPAPGGGSAAALEGALGMGLFAMVCRLTEGKEAYKEYKDHIVQIQNGLDELQGELLKLVDMDTEAFLNISKAFAMPKATENQKKARSENIQQSLVLCIKVPMMVMKIAAQGLVMADMLSGKFNTAASSDFGVAVLSLRSAVQGAWLNVCINVKSLKDRAQAEKFDSEGREILNTALPRADKLYQAAMDAM